MTFFKSFSSWLKVPGTLAGFSALRKRCTSLNISSVLELSAVVWIFSGLINFRAFSALDRVLVTACCIF